MNSRIEELEGMETKTKVLCKELEKSKEFKRLMEEELVTTDIDPDENPSAYTTNELTVKRAISNATIILRFM